MAKLSGSLTTYPARAALLWYLGTITVGTAALFHPLSASDPRAPLSLLDALFTATSATCVTGLTVRSTAVELSRYGQIIVLILIQLGGIGILSVTTYLTLRLGSSASLRQQVLVTETLGSDRKSDLLWVLHGVFLFTVTFELAGFLILAAYNPWRTTMADRLWQALFHSISAFCNAGFALADDSLGRFQGDLIVNFTIMTLIVVGGIGFPVVLDLWRHRRLPRGDRWSRLSVHTKVMLLGTIALLTLGTVSFLALEWHNALAGMSPGRRVLVASFQSVTARTAGFQTIDLTHLTDATLVVLVMLMMIGAGPCSTGGGFKVSTFMALVLSSWSSFRGRTRVSLFRRTLPQESIDRAVATALLFGTLGAVALTMLLAFEATGHPEPGGHGRLLDTLFEVISALGTVGLSTNTTTTLDPSGRIIIIILMFLGRLGPISVFLALSRTTREAHTEYPEEDLLIG